MHEAFKVFILSTIIITVWTAFLLLQDQRGNKRLNRWFAAFLVALTLPQLDLYVNQVIQGGNWQLSFLASTFLWLKGPFMWTFINILTRRETRVSNWFHFVPWLCVITTVMFFPQTVMVCIYMGMAHMLGYLLVSLRRLVIMRPYLADIWGGFQNSAYYWLLYVIGGLMLLTTVDFVFMSLMQYGILRSYEVLDFYAFPAFSVYVLSIGILSVYRPEMLFREPQQISQETSEENSAAELDQKERHLELDVGLAQTLSENLTSLMQEQHLYRKNELALPDLAAALGISVHQVSELLNVHLGVGFYDYINSFRLKYACSLLANPNCHLRVLDIAFEAGYNNKNSFYRAFKENLGLTPNQYRANALAPAAGQAARV